MANPKDIARDVLGALSSDAGFLTALRWVDLRYQELVSRVKFKHLRQIGELRLEAKYSTGTLSATKGSTTVSGSSTKWKTEYGTGSLTDHYLYVKNTWYKIASITDETTLELTTAYTGDNISGESYSIVRRFYPLDSSVRWLGNFALFTRLRSPIEIIPPERLDYEAPGRYLVSSHPRFLAQVGTDSSGAVRVEIYPYPSSTEIIHYPSWSLPSTLSAASTIPPQVDDYILREGALIDHYRYLKGKAITAGRYEAAGYYRNEEKTQLTLWERYIERAIQADRGADDLTFTLVNIGGHGYRQDIRTARDHIYSRWEYPSS